MAEETADSVQWSNADIEFPSTSTDDEVICKLLSALPMASETVPNIDAAADVCNLDEDNSFDQLSSREYVTESEADVQPMGKHLDKSLK